MHQKILFVTNPNSGIDRQKDLESVIEKYLDKSKFQYQLIFTQYAGHGTEIAQEAVRNGVENIVAIGGDGSVNDIVKGILGSDVNLAIIPKGSGNGLARSVYLPLDPVKAIDVINQHHVARIDVGIANGIPFVSNAGVGFDAVVAKKFAKSTKRGFWAYSAIVTKLLWNYQTWKWNIKVDGKEVKERAFILTVANAEQFGYNFKIAPNANLQDGLFDIVLVDQFPKLMGGRIALQAFAGKIYDSKYVKHFQGKKVVIEHSKMRLMQVDGDVYPCDGKVEINFAKSKINMIIPSN